MKTIFVVLLFTLGNSFMNAQKIEKHQWEHRIIVVSSPTFGNELANKQLVVLKKDLPALKERKLVIYHVTNTGYTVDFDDDIKISENNEFAISKFQVALIGLDGTQKFHATDVQKAAIFFNLIDAMPMRRAEIKNRKDE